MLDDVNAPVNPYRKEDPVARTITIDIDTGEWVSDTRITHEEGARIAASVLPGTTPGLVDDWYSAWLRSDQRTDLAPTRAAMPALLGFVEDVRAMIRDRHRGIGATSDYDIGHRDGWNDALRVIERALTERIEGEG